MNEHSKVLEYVDEFKFLSGSYFSYLQDIKDRYKLDELDARLTTFAKCCNVFSNTFLSLQHFEYNLKRDSWYMEFNNIRIKEGDKLHYAKEYFMFTKLSCQLIYFSSIESGLRNILRALDPKACNKGNAEFESVYLALLIRLNLREYKPVLDLLRCTRNTIHNNGVYFNPNKEGEEILFKGNTYNFKNGEPIKYVTFDFLIGCFTEVGHMLYKMCKKGRLSSVPFILDPYKDYSVDDIKDIH
ncbi:hypothetical protein FB479_111112 [Brevibacillus sp. AG162]|uniref:hypothetical protein n=1 Tax=Brevibacillus sp. AG162 TaxID=2572910 RepID=UPI0011518F07|nr:hypothetical protein [Brevibacillus sp. AG162]TQK53292.1 hypothetical protein FB479_111112 [Brevibacillus sp. AG162]